MKGYTPSRNSIILILLFYAVPLFLFICLIGLFWGIGKLEYIRWKNSTSPLPSNVQIDLCQKFHLPEDSTLCTSKNVLAPSFYSTIEKYFSSRENSFEVVQEMLGEYYWETENMGQSSLGEEYYRVYYDFRGDGKYAVVFYFSKSGNFIKLQEYYAGMD